MYIYVYRSQKLNSCFRFIRLGRFFFQNEDTRPHCFSSFKILPHLTLDCIRTATQTCKRANILDCYIFLHSYNLHVQTLLETKWSSRKKTVWWCPNITYFPLPSVFMSLIFLFFAPLPVSSQSLENKGPSGKNPRLRKWLGKTD